MKTNHKLLIANRGEIAIRIARTAKAMGIATVGIYSKHDLESEFIEYMDEAIPLQGESTGETYLNIAQIIEIALATQSTMIHPGYGFLSERASFVQACEKSGILFVGPTASSMNIMGDKIAARNKANELGLPGVPGSNGAVTDGKELHSLAKKIGFPVLLKATAGGGGKGMRLVENEEDLESALASASREALAAFGDGAMYLEKYVINPHHVEIQVFGDGKGGGVHLGERECSIQRRHQKVWEESPSPILERHPETREKMLSAALRVVAGLNYRGAGTLEFIVDEEGNHYFLEMNTRLQVEHPITEWVTGVDLVRWQLELAMGTWVNPKLIEFRGSAVEVRIYAEDPHTFLPAPGRFNFLRIPAGPFIRWDSSFSRAGAVSMNYDPMIAKLSAWGPTRADAIGRINVALQECSVQPKVSSNLHRSSGLKTNLTFLRRLCLHKDVLDGNTRTSLIADNPELTELIQDPLEGDHLQLAASMFLRSTQMSLAAVSDLNSQKKSQWMQVARSESIRGPTT